MMKTIKSLLAVVPAVAIGALVLCVESTVLRAADASPGTNDVTKIESTYAIPKDKLPEWLKSLTDLYRPQAQKILETHNINGRAINLLVDDAGFENGTLFFQLELVWQKPNTTYGILRIVVGYDPKQDKFVCDEIATMTEISDGQLEALRGIKMENGESIPIVSSTVIAADSPSPAVISSPQTIVAQAEPSPTPAKQEEPGFYERNKTEIDHAAIGIGAVGAGALMKHFVDSMFNSSQ
ncbi:hypothetical protein BH09VER1_BH09VER1_23890 [soil metagenome]